MGMDGLAHACRKAQAMAREASGATLGVLQPIFLLSWMMRNPAIGTLREHAWRKLKGPAMAKAPAMGVQKGEDFC